MRKISVSLSGHKTSLTMEPEFIHALQEIASHTHRPIAQIIGDIDATRKPGENLSSAVRVWILKNISKS